MIITNFIIFFSSILKFEAMENDKFQNSSNNKPFKKNKKKKSEIVEDEISRLNEKISQLDSYNPDEVDSFAKLPISLKTLKGLKENDFTVPTKVQRTTLIHSLKGSDVVAAAKTGSGKTLGFVIPLLDLLFRNKWSIADGLGAVIITPTRELAYQIYELIKKVGKHHNFSSALVIGGKDWKYEKYSVSRCNILICTPGRLHHHITAYSDFDCSKVQILVLDEADMCLSMGFADDMNAIFDELPQDKQTLLFSATQTKEVKDLVRAGCKSPVFCSVHEHSKTSTPKTLKESYLVCDVHDKLNFLWSFLKHHKKNKTLVFFATCKQVRFINSIFRQLRPGLPVLNIHGAMHQLRRMAVYDEFCRKEHAVLFATDVAARGLDIPSVDWVLQYDCPEDETTYIHRAGRTARYSQNGEAILLVTPNEEENMINKLKRKNIPIEKIAADPKKLQRIQRSVENILVKHNHIFLEAQRAFKSYLKNIALMRNKDVFDPFSIDLDEYAKSLGLEVTPRIRFLEKRQKKSKIVQVVDAEEDSDDDDFLVSSKKEDSKTFDDNIDVSKISFSDDETNSSEIPSNDLVDEKISKKKTVTKAAVVKKLKKRNLQLNSKIAFDDDGEAIIDPYKHKTAEQQIENRTIDIDKLKNTMKAEDKIDKKIYADRLKEKHRKEKSKLKEERKAKQNKVSLKDENDSESMSDSDLDDDTQNIIDSLPDPDKIYGNKNNSEESDSSSDDNQSEECEDEEDSDESEESTLKISGKRKARQKARDIKRARLVQNNNLETLPVSEQEQLALYLLKNR